MQHNSSGPPHVFGMQTSSWASLLKCLAATIASLAKASDFRDWQGTRRSARHSLQHLTFVTTDPNVTCPRLVSDHIAKTQFQQKLMQLWILVQKNTSLIDCSRALQRNWAPCRTRQDECLHQARCPRLNRTKQKLLVLEFSNARSYAQSSCCMKGV